MSSNAAPVSSTSSGGGFVLWFTGLSGAGKTTLAGALVPVLKAAGARIETLDGDEVRDNLSKGLGFSQEDRDTNIRRIGYVAKLLSRNGVGVIVAAISPYRAIRDEVRKSVPNFIEVFVKASVETCTARDVKGLYKKALAGEIKNFTGVSDPYEEPLSAEIVVDTEKESVQQSADRVLALLRHRGLIPTSARV